jgi:hypothetical protein
LSCPEAVPPIIRRKKIITQDGELCNIVNDSDVSDLQPRIGLLEMPGKNSLLPRILTKFAFA